MKESDRMIIPESLKKYAETSDDCPTYDKNKPDYRCSVDCSNYRKDKAAEEVKKRKCRDK